MSSRCRFCRNDIKWVEVLDESGALKHIPLDLKAHVYHFDGEKYIRSGAFVNHFSVCPSRKKQRKPEKEKPKEQPWWVK